MNPHGIGELAEGLALLTLDLGLARAAQKIGVKLQEF